jgi:hypothetical protein
VLIDRDRKVLFVERRFGPRGEPLGVTEQRFALETRDWKPEDWKPETGDWRLETGDWRLKAGQAAL